MSPLFGARGYPGLDALDLGVRERLRTHGHAAPTRSSPQLLDEDRVFGRLLRGDDATACARLVEDPRAHAGRLQIEVAGELRTAVTPLRPAALGEERRNFGA